MFVLEKEIMSQTKLKETIAKCSNCKTYTVHRFYGEGGYVITVHKTLPFGAVWRKFDFWVCSECGMLKSIDGKRIFQ